MEVNKEELVGTIVLFFFILFFLFSCCCIGHCVIVPKEKIPLLKNDENNSIINLTEETSL